MFMTVLYDGVKQFESKAMLQLAVFCYNFTEAFYCGNFIHYQCCYYYDENYNNNNNYHSAILLPEEMTILEQMSKMRGMNTKPAEPVPKQTSVSFVYFMSHLLFQYDVDILQMYRGSFFSPNNLIVYCFS